TTAESVRRFLKWRMWTDVFKDLQWPHFAPIIWTADNLSAADIKHLRFKGVTIEPRREQQFLCFLAKQPVVEDVVNVRPLTEVLQQASAYDGITILFQVAVTFYLLEDLLRYTRMSRLPD